ncbi:MAG: immunoglobulin-like domain-containing protein, partial [Tumebacillaceae bacterium]
MKKKTSKFLAATLILSTTLSSAAVVAPTSVVAATSPDQQAVNAAKTALVDSVILNDNSAKSNITGDLTLPTEGINGTTITWTSNKSDVVTTTGVVHRPRYDKSDVTVTLTAKISKGTANTTKTFSVTVKKKAQNDADSVAAEFDSLVEKTIKGSNTDLTAVTKKLNLVTTGVTATHTTITWSSNKPGVVAADGTVTRPAYMDGDAAVILTATISKGQVNTTKTFSVNVQKNSPVTDVEKILYAVNAITESSIKGSNKDLAHITQKLNLPTTGANGVKITWSSDTDAIQSNGKIVAPSYLNGDVTGHLTATFSFGNAPVNTSISEDLPNSKTFTVTVLRANPTSDTDRTSADSDALNVDKIKKQNADLDEVTGNLTLPTSGTYGSQIKWTSSDASVISTSGIVHRPNFGAGNKTVTLTAVVSKGAVTRDPKTFTVTVLEKEPASDTDAVVAAKNAITLGDIDLHAVVSDLTLPTTGPYGTTISWASSNTDVIGTDGKVTRPATVNADVVLTATITKHNVTQTRTFNVTVSRLGISDLEAVTHAKESLTLANLDAVVSDLTLPSSGTDGTTITWSSNQPAVIDNTGKVNRPAYNQQNATVKLTATITKGSDSVTKDFTATVLKKTETDSEAVAAAQAALTLGNTSAVVSDLTLPTTGADGTTITWTSSNTAVVSNSGKVTRPAYNASDVTLSLMATITKGSQTMIKEFSVTVLKKVETDAEAVAAAQAVLTLGNTSEVVSDLTLPTTGADGTTITWASSNTAVVSNSGKVTRPAYNASDVTLSM